MNSNIRVLLQQASSEAISAIRAADPTKAEAHQNRSTSLSIKAARLLASHDSSIRPRQATISSRG